MSRLATTLAALLVGALALASAASAKTIGEYHQVRALLPMHIESQIGFVPIGGIGGLEDIVSIRVGGNVYRGPWANALAGRPTFNETLKELRRYHNSHGVFADRALTRKERRYFEVLADIGRDADVLAVQSGNPACAGLTLAQARGIAAGKITQWSAVVPGAGGAIALRDTVVDQAYHPLFGVAKKPVAAKGRADGGLADAAKDPSVAAITSWGRARSAAGVCVVPLGGVTPTNATVFDLTFPGAFPITFVAPKKRDRGILPRTELRLYVKFLKSEKAKRLFAGNGVIVSSGEQTTGGGNGAQGPSRDAQGRTITSVRDDAAVTNALTGERIAAEGAGYHWAFEGGGLLRYIQSGDTCSQSEGHWTVVEGYSYSEYGGGVIAQVTFDIDGTANTVTLDLPNDPPGVAYMNGATFSRSRSLPGSC